MVAMSRDSVREMSEVSTLVLFSTGGFLIAADVPMPIEIPALAMVALVLRFLLRRDARSHDRHNARLDQIEAELDSQRTAKHAFRNELTTLRAALSVIIIQARKCSCGTMEPLLPTLEHLALDTKEPTS